MGGQEVEGSWCSSMDGWGCSKGSRYCSKPGELHGQELSQETVRMLNALRMYLGDPCAACKGHC